VSFTSTSLNLSRAGAGCCHLPVSTPISHACLRSLRFTFWLGGQLRPHPFLPLATFTPRHACHFDCCRLSIAYILNIVCRHLTSRMYGRAVHSLALAAAVWRGWQLTATLAHHHHLPTTTCLCSCPPPPAIPHTLPHAAFLNNRSRGSNRRCHSRMGLAQHAMPATCMTCDRTWSCLRTILALVVCGQQCMGRSQAVNGYE